MSLTAIVQLVLSWLEEDGDGVVVVLSSFESQVEREAVDEIPSLQERMRTSRPVVHINQFLACSGAKSNTW